MNTLREALVNPEVLADKVINDLLEYKEVSLSAANIIAMNGTPVEIVAAPGSGKYLSVSKIIFEITRTATAFTGGGVTTFQYSGGAVVHASSIPASVITGGAGRVITELNVNTQANGVTIPENTKLTITNGTGAFAAGTGTAKVKIWYKTITAS